MTHIMWVEGLLGLDASAFEGINKYICNVKLVNASH